VVQCRADVVWLQEPPRERRNIGISHSADKLRKRTIVWTAIRKGSGRVVDEQTNLCRRANNHVIATDMWSSVDKMTRIVNIYDQTDG